MHEKPYLETTTDILATKDQKLLQVISVLINCVDETREHCMTLTSSMLAKEALRKLIKKHEDNDEPGEPIVPATELIPIANFLQGALRVRNCLNCSNKDCEDRNKGTK